MDVKKTKVESLDIIVTMMEGKPYYAIKYKEVGSDHFCIGYSSYRLDYALEWKKEYFELVEREAGAGQGWIPVSERLPKKHEDALTTTRYDGFLGRYGTWIETGFINDIGEWSGACIGGKVIAWMPLPEPYKEKTE